MDNKKNDNKTMTERWIKDGVFADMTMEINGRVVSNPTDEMLRKAGYEPYVPSDEELLRQAKEAKTQEITAYDTSSAVNGFKLNGQKVWLDFELRDRVYQGNERLQRIGRKDTTLWLGKQCYKLSIEQAQNLISQIEAYAKDCYNVTAAHKAAVEKLQTVEEVLGYDYKTGYPKQLEITI